MIIAITRHGHPAAVVMSADDLEIAHETLHRLSRPVRPRGDRRREHANGQTTSGQALRAESGLPPR